MNKKKLSLSIFYTTVILILLHLVNKLLFFVSTMKELLYSSNNNYYNWRFGKVFYTVKGSGTPLLLVHDMNAFSSSYEWKETIQAFSKNHTVYAIDLLGCGRSDKPKITYTNYLYVQLLSDFIKNVIKQKTNIIATGNSSSAAILSCFTDQKLYDKLILVNPLSISKMNQYPRYKNKICKHIIDFPIIGTTLYNIASNSFTLRSYFYKEAFADYNKVKIKQIQAYVEAAHLGGTSSKFMYSSVKSHYTNINIVHALKALDQSIYIVGGEKETDIKQTFSDYTSFNPAIETAFIHNTKHLPQLEKSPSFVRICEIFLS